MAQKRATRRRRLSPAATDRSLVRRPFDGPIVRRRRRVVKTARVKAARCPKPSPKKTASTATSVRRLKVFRPSTLPKLKLTLSPAPVLQGISPMTQRFLPKLLLDLFHATICVVIDWFFVSHRCILMEDTLDRESEHRGLSARPFRPGFSQGSGPLSWRRIRLDAYWSRTWV